MGFLYATAPLCNAAIAMHVWHRNAIASATRAHLSFSMEQARLQGLRLNCLRTLPASALTMQLKAGIAAYLFVLHVAMAGWRRAGVNCHAVGKRAGDFLQKSPPPLAQRAVADGQPDGLTAATATDHAAGGEQTETQRAHVQSPGSSGRQCFP